jgi:hypothetical protein
MGFVITVLADIIEFLDSLCSSEMPFSFRYHQAQGVSGEKQKPIPFENRLCFNPTFIGSPPGHHVL